MKAAKFIKEEDISFEEVSENWVSLKLGAEKFVIDTDTLIDLSFRCASFLAYLENKQEAELSTSAAPENENLCCHHKNTLH